MEKQFHESGLNVTQNQDGSYQFEWDPKDSRWSWLNGLTSKEIQVIMEQTLQDDSDAS